MFRSHGHNEYTSHASEVKSGVISGNKPLRERSQAHSSKKQRLTCAGLRALPDADTGTIQCANALAGEILILEGTASAAPIGLYIQSRGCS